MSDQHPDYDDLSSEEAFRVGLLAELTQIRVALETLAAQHQHPEANADEEPTAKWECSVEGVAFDSDAAARQHAVNTHNAPRDADAWKHIMTRVDTE